MVTPLNGSAEPVEVAVEAENWLSALRLARKELGEDGGMPPGASCVMSATGEVTILDAAQRLRYVLTRVSTMPAAPAAPDPVPSAQIVSPPKAPENQNQSWGPQVPVVGPTTPRRSATIAYSAEESVEARKQLLAARPAGFKGELPQQPAPPTAAPVPAAPSPAFSPMLPGAMAQPLTAAPGTSVVPAPANAEAPAPKRSVTVAYSPEESADFRKQLQAAAQLRNQKSSASEPEPSPESLPPQPAPAVQAPVPAPQLSPPTVQPVVGTQVPGAASPSASRKATVAYLQSPFVAGGDLILIHSRDESPNSASPLTYRERSYFAPKPVDPDRLESALRTELENLVRGVGAGSRGQFVNLAVFDHQFQGRPQRPPVATLQWKDWRGAPVFAMAGAQPLPSWRPAPAGVPVANSFVPPAPSAPPAASVSAPAPVSVPAPPVAFTPPMPAAFLPPAQAPQVAPVAAPPRAAPSSPIVTPARPVSDVGEFGSEPTGDQDRRLAIAFEASQDLYFMATPVEGLEFAVKLLGDLVPCEAASGCIYDINTDEFRFVALSGPGATERRAEAVPSTEGLLAAAIRAGRDTFTTSNVESDTRYDPAIDGRVGLTVDTLAYLPLQKRDNLLGVLQLINRKSRTGFSDADMAVAGYLASQVAEFLQSRRTGGRR